MTKCIGASVRQGRIEVAVPSEWPDGTEVRIELVCRANLTAEDSALTGAEMAVIWDAIGKAENERSTSGELPPEQR